jgi:arsenical pump membrane protein
VRTLLDRHAGGAGVVVGAIGLGALAAALAIRPSAAHSAAAQDWSPFVLVAGRLLIGRVAGDDGLFAAAGRRLAGTARSGVLLFVGTTVLVGSVTALLNLDTSVAFLTPVLVYTARSRGGGEAPLLYGCLLLSNAGSLFLPGSNLTNLIVLGHLHLSGAQFLAHMWAPALVSLLLTAAVIGVVEHRELRSNAATVTVTVTASATVELDPTGLPAFRPGLGLAAVVLAAVLVVTLHSPALPVAIVGVCAVTIRVTTGREQLRRVADALSLPLLLGLFGVAVALGTLGRAWSAPATLLSHAGAWGTAVTGAVASVAVNNLPAASLLAARSPGHPYALLIGLNLGPNLFVTGSLAWFLWMKSARQAGARPSVVRACRIGVIAAPLALAAALVTLILTGSS